MRRNSIVTCKSITTSGLSIVPVSSVILCEDTKILYIKKSQSTADNISSGLLDGSIEYVDTGMEWDQILDVDGIGSGLDCDLVRGLPAIFDSNLSSNGYQKLPSGKIYQWGSASKKIGSGNTTHPFNISFPNTVLMVFIFQYDEVGSTTNCGYILRFKSSTLNNFTVTEDNFNTNGRNASSNFNWLAFGE